MKTSLFVIRKTLLPITSLYGKVDEKFEAEDAYELKYLQSTLPFVDTVPIEDASQTQEVNLVGNTQVLSFGGETEVLYDPDCIESMSTQILDDFDTPVASDIEGEGTEETEVFGDNDEQSDNETVRSGNGQLVDSETIYNSLHDNSNKGFAERLDPLPYKENGTGESSLENLTSTGERLTGSKSIFGIPSFDNFPKAQFCYVYMNFVCICFHRRINEKLSSSSKTFLCLFKMCDTLLLDLKLTFVLCCDLKKIKIKHFCFIVCQKLFQLQHEVEGSHKPKAGTCFFFFLQTAMHIKQLSYLCKTLGKSIFCYFK